jgi:hypothetical protein
VAQSILHLTVEIDREPGAVERDWFAPAGRPLEAMTRLTALMGAASARLVPCAVTVSLESTSSRAHASATATFSGVPTADDTVVIGPTTLTWKASAANQSQITIGGSAAASATALAAAINAHTALAGLVSASAADTVVTISSDIPGRVGNLVTLAETGTTVALSATALTGGVGTSQVASRQYVLGLAG